MNPSTRLVELFKVWEGFENGVYLDVAGLPTIGIGHLLTRSELSSGKIVIDGVAVKYANGLTDDQVFSLFFQDLSPMSECVNKKVKVPLTQNQFDALVSFCFNIGEPAFTGSTLLKLLNAGQYDAVPGQLKRWNRSGGRISKGLINRRNNEIKLWSRASI